MDELAHETNEQREKMSKITSFVKMCNPDMGFGKGQRADL